MDFDLKIPKFLLAPLLAGLTLSAVVKAEAMDTYKVDLDKFKSAKKLTAEQIGRAVPLLTDHETAWAKGIVGPIKPGSISIKPTNKGEASITKSLVINYAGVAKNPYELRSCSPQGECDSVSYTIEKRVLNFTHEGIHWEMINSVGPCDKELSCEFVIPSWSLEKRRLLTEGTMQAFPDVAVILDSTAGITIFDALNGTEWLTIAGKSSGSQIDRLGPLQGARFSGDSFLSVQFAKGLLIADFISDRLFVMTSTEVFLAKDGLGQAKATTWEKLKLVAGDVSGVPLAASMVTLVWSEGLTSWSPRATKSTKILGTWSDQEKTLLAAQAGFGRGTAAFKMDSMVSSSTEIKLQSLDLLSGSWKTLSTKAIDPENKTSYVLSDGDLFAVEKGGDKEALVILPLATGVLSTVTKACEPPKETEDAAVSAALPKFAIAQNKSTEEKTSGLTTACDSQSLFSATSSYLGIASVKDGKFINVSLLRP